MAYHQSTEEQLIFAARHGDRATFERLGGTEEQWNIMRGFHRCLQPRELGRGIV